MLNVETLDKLCTEIGEETLAELLTFFIDEARARLDRIAAHIETGDLSALDGEAHALKGSARTYGLSQLGDLAETVERAGEAGDKDEVLSVSRTLIGVASDHLDALKLFTKSLESQVS